MASTSATPAQQSSRHDKSTSRPTTPLRRSSRSSFTGARGSDYDFPLNLLEPQFAELSDAMVTLEANFGDLQVMHDSLSRFSESFASFLYGLNMNAFCVDFPEAPVKESFQRAAENESGHNYGGWRADHEGETTFMTNDTSFVHEPPPPSKTPATPHRGSRGRAGRSSGTRGGRGGQGSSGVSRGRGGVSRYK